MPDRPPNRFERERRLSDLDTGRQYIKVRCTLCGGKGRNYYPADLMRLLSNVPVLSLRLLMRCEKCGRKEYIQTEVFSPSAADRQAMKVRRLVEVKVRKLPVWREE